MADGKDVRASDAERDLVLGQLRDEFAAGRLSRDTLQLRIDAALRARRRAELYALLGDLPATSIWVATAGTLARLRDRIHDRARMLTAAGAPAGRERPPAMAAPVPLLLPTGPQRRFTIGREPSCDMMLGDLTVSRWHATLLRGAGDGWLLADLGSTNGTRLNGWRVTAPSPVGPGDHIAFGDANFVLTDRPAVTC